MSLPIWWEKQNLMKTIGDFQRHYRWEIGVSYFQVFLHLLKWISVS
jgi:hypothetical protein